MGRAPDPSRRTSEAEARQSRRSKNPTTPKREAEEVLTGVIISAASKYRQEKKVAGRETERL
jgi:hypothetical protein